MPKALTPRGPVEGSINEQAYLSGFLRLSDHGSLDVTLDRES
jgi:hypothetical protein